MMIHNYNSLKHEADRMEYKQELDSYFGHGSAKVIDEKRSALLYMARPREDDDRSSSWFPDPSERRFFTSCMELIAEHDEGEREKRNRRLPARNLDDPELWSRINLSKAKQADEDTGKSGTHGPGDVTEAVPQPIASSRTRPPVITYDSVTNILTEAIEEFF